MNSIEDQKNNNSRMGMFVSLLTKHQSQIYSYILSFVPNFSEADDLMQETTKFMWEKFDLSEDTNKFKAWAVQIAHYRVLEYFNRRQKERKLHFNKQLTEEIENDLQKRSDNSKEYLAYLSRCLKKLALRDKDMVRLRYQKNLDVKKISEYFRKSPQSIYQNIARIHEQLLRCVRRQIAQKGI